MTWAEGMGDLIDTYRVVTRARTGVRIPNRYKPRPEPVVDALRWYRDELCGKRARRVLREAGL